MSNDRNSEYVATITAPKPPENTVNSKFLGNLTFQDGYPTPETLQTLYDQIDFQRATQAFLRNLLALNMYGLRLGISRDLGVDSIITNRPDVALQAVGRSPGSADSAITG